MMPTRLILLFRVAVGVVASGGLLENAYKPSKGFPERVAAQFRDAIWPPAPCSYVPFRDCVARSIHSARRRQVVVDVDLRFFDCCAVVCVAARWSFSFLRTQTTILSGMHVSLRLDEYSILGSSLGNSLRLEIAL